MHYLVPWIFRIVFCSVCLVFAFPTSGEEAAVALGKTGAALYKAMALIRQGKLVEAKQFVDTEFSRDPQSLHPAMAWGILLQLMNKTDEARAHFETAAKERPDDPRVLVALAGLERHCGRPEEEFDLLLRARDVIRALPDADLKKAATLLSVNLDLARIFQRQQKWAEVQASLEELRELVVERCDTQLMLARALVFQNQVPAAREVLVKAAAHDKALPDVDVLLAHLLEEHQQYDQATKLMKEVLARDLGKSNVKTYLCQIRWLVRSGQTTAALRLAGEGTKVHAKSIDLALCRWWLMGNSDRPSDPEWQPELFADARPLSPDANFFVAAIFGRRHKSTTEMKLLEAAIANGNTCTKGDSYFVFELDARARLAELKAAEERVPRQQRPEKEPIPRQPWPKKEPNRDIPPDRLTHRVAPASDRLTCLCAA